MDIISLAALLVRAPIRVFRDVVLLAVVGLAFAPLVTAEEPLPVPSHIARPKVREPEDGDPTERRKAVRALTAPMTEARKQNFLNALARQRLLYANQASGANYPAGMPVWQSIGPRTSKYSWNGIFIDGVDSGRIRRVLTDPANADHVYVQTSGGGLWATHNFSAATPTWDALTDSVLSTSGGSFALGRTAQTLYLGIGDPFDVYPTVAGVIIKSTDGGRSWGPFINLPNATSIRDIEIDSSGPADVVLVATDVGVFRSADGGATYTLSAVAQGTGRVSAWSIARSSAGWLLNTVDPAFDSLLGGSGELYLSTDVGKTWTAIAAETDVFSSVGRATLALASAGESIVYAIASTSDGFSQADVYRSVDGGRSWTALNVTARQAVNPNCYQEDLNILGDQAYYNQMIAVSPQDKTRNTLYIGGNLSTAKTSDGGATWTLTSSWLPRACDGVTPTLPYAHADNHAAEIRVVNGVERIVFGTDGGIFVSTDGGNSFDSDKNIGIVALLAQTMSSTPRRADSAITGLQDTGTRARIGRSQLWNQVYGGDGEGVGWSQTNNAATIATFEYSGIVHQMGLPANTGDPNNWLDGTNGLDFADLDCFPFYTPIATPTAIADPTGLVFYTASGARLYKTTDGAASWNQVTLFGTVDAPQCVIKDFGREIALHPTDRKRIALSGYGGTLMVTTDGGVTWKTRSIGASVPGFTASSTPAWAPNGTLYLAAYADLVTFGGPRVAKSVDLGVTWTQADAGLPDVQVNDLAVDPRDRSGQIVYASTPIGVYVTRDGGKSWRLYGAGLPNVDVESMYLSPGEPFLRIATYGRGVWEIDLQ